MKKQTTGFTLIELILYLSLLVILYLSLFSFLTMAFAGRTKSEAISEVEQQGGQIAEIITQTIRTADSINLPAAGASGSTLSLAFTDASKNPTIFQITNNALTIKIGSAAAVPLNNSHVLVSNMVFANYSRANTPGVIHASYTITAATSTRQEFNYVQTFTTGASLR
jgi:Tfp pilus assembly protein PilW